MKQNNTDIGMNEQDSSEQSPIDEIISQVDSYIKNPKLVTSETLQELKTNLEDLKNYLDSEEHGEPQERTDNAGGRKPMLTVLIGMHKKQGGE